MRAYHVALIFFLLAVAVLPWGGPILSEAESTQPRELSRVVFFVQ